jgi:hypothetical protein
MKRAYEEISVKGALGIAAFLSIGVILLDVIINYPYPKLIHGDIGEFIYNVGMFSVLQYVANVGIILGIPRIPHHI